MNRGVQFLLCERERIPDAKLHFFLSIFKADANLIAANAPFSLLFLVPISFALALNLSPIPHTRSAPVFIPTPLFLLQATNLPSKSCNRNP
ncbi:hypothetical protein KFK09_003435 [Dendrobium nobile]|uniref:Uncharacterized protein n=1 Tax=Dendrobium nobile TaxID=94219 RepID=A0A8T3C351_DENNO|nr:hypothetical protein KFK09_003435 [Dendrobium nobile]